MTSGTGIDDDSTIQELMGVFLNAVNTLETNSVFEGESNDSVLRILVSLLQYVFKNNRFWNEVSRMALDYCFLSKAKKDHLMFQIFIGTMWWYNQSTDFYSSILSRMSELSEHEVPLFLAIGTIDA